MFKDEFLCIVLRIAVFGDRVSQSDYAKMRPSAWALFQCDWFIKRRETLDTQRETGGAQRKGHVRTQGEGGH